MSSHEAATRKRTSRSTWIAASTVLASGLAVMAYGLISGVAGSSPPAKTVASMPSDVAAHFAVLRRSQSPGDLPDGSVPIQEFSTFRANPALAREVNVADVGHRVYDPMLIVPGGDSVCLVHKFDLSGTCQSLSDALAGETVTWAACLPGLQPGQIRVTGLVPDGVVNVTLDRSDGTEQVTRTTDNVYDFVTPNARALPVRVTFDSDGQSRAVSTPIDQGEIPPTCAGQYGWTAP